jgi:hypothetical protein
MPQLVTFRGQPVKRRRLLPEGLRLTFVSPVPGEQGRMMIVTQAEWLRYGRIQFYPRGQMPDVRSIADQFEP